MNDHTLPGSPALWAGSFTNLHVLHSFDSSIPLTSTTRPLKIQLHLFPDKKVGLVDSLSDHTRWFSAISDFE